MEREALKLALEALGKAKRQIVHAKVAPHGCIGDAITAIKEALAQPSDSVEKPIDFELAYGEIYKDQRAALAKSLAQPAQERNFCPRCGKRTADLTVIHTCTPPQEKNNG